MIWLRPDEAAKWLQVSLSTIYVIAHREGWARQGKGAKTRYSFADIDATREARFGRIEARTQDPGDRANGPGA